MDLNPTTRMYPRRLQDAFRDDCEYASWYEPHEKHISIWDYIVGGAGVMLWICIAYYFAT